MTCTEPRGTPHGGASVKLRRRLKPDDPLQKDFDEIRDFVPDLEVVRVEGAQPTGVLWDRRGILLAALGF